MFCLSFNKKNVFIFLYNSIVAAIFTISIYDEHKIE